MRTDHLIQVSVLAGLLALAGCTTPQETLAEEGYTSMTPAEISGLYSGNTVRTTQGSDYYAPDGSYVSSWKGTIYNGTWTVEEPNQLCWQVAEWGSIFFYIGEAHREFRREFQQYGLMYRLDERDTWDDQ